MDENNKSISWDDFMKKVIELFPNAFVDEDPHTGELIVYTGLIENNSVVRSMAKIY